MTPTCAPSTGSVSLSVSEHCREAMNIATLNKCTVQSPVLMPSLF